MKGVSPPPHAKRKTPTACLFGGFLHNQAVGFRRRLELLVVVGAGSGSVLNPFLKVPQVNHFMDQGGTGFLKGPVQVFSAKVDFIEPAFFGSVLPRLPAGTPSIGPTGVIRGNGDHGLFQLPAPTPGKFDYNRLTNSEFADMLAHLLAEKGMTQADLCKATNIGAARWPVGGGVVML